METETGECPVNGFHVNAVGWILTCNALTLSQSEARELAGLWTDLVQVRDEDICKAHPLLHLMLLRSIPLSDRALGAFATLVNRMACLRPERFGCDALRRRRSHWALQVAVAFLLCFLAATLLPKAWPLVDDIVLTLFIMGCVFGVSTITLWRATSAVGYFNANRNVKWNPPQGMSGRPLTRSRPGEGVPDAEWR
jgi:hypothetical protein